MAASDVVQFRFAAADLAYLRARGLEPNRVAKERLEGLVRRLRFEESYDRLRADPIDVDDEPTEIIRRAREGLR